MVRDVYEDGELSDNELVLLEQQRIDRRQDNQKKMAWIAMFSMIGFTVFMFLPIVGDTRIEILTEIASLFYIAQAGVIGAYMGSEALVNKSRNQVKGKRGIQ
jgi:hypothetical protein